MRRAIKRSSHRSENRDSVRKESEPNPPGPAEAKLPGSEFVEPEFVEPESVEPESPGPKRSGPKPTKLPLWISWKTTRATRTALALPCIAWSR